MKILVIQQKMIGDVLTSTILLEVLRNAYPNADLHFLINKNTKPVVENNPFVNKLVILTPEISESKFLFYQFLKHIQKEQYDIVIDVYGKLSSLLITYFSKAKISISYKKRHSSIFYTHTITRNRISINEVSLAIENRMKLLSPLNIPFTHITPKIYLTETEKQQAKDYLETNNLDFSYPIFMISVLGSSKNKTYPAPYMAKILDYIVANNFKVQLLFNYIPLQKQEACEIYNLCCEQTKNSIKFEVFSEDLRQFMAITSYCKAIIGNEGGAIQMAKAVGVASFAIFCPFINIENWFGNLENGKHIAVHIKDYITFSKKDFKKAKKHPLQFYHPFKPELIFPKLKQFLVSLER